MYEVARSLPDVERYALAQQMIRAAVSLTNNMAEGYGRYNWQETIQFFRHSRGSLYELVDDVNVCLEQGYISQEQHQQLRAEAEPWAKQINGYIRYLRDKKSQNDQWGPRSRLLGPVVQIPGSSYPLPGSELLIPVSRFPDPGS